MLSVQSLANLNFPEKRRLRNYMVKLRAERGDEVKAILHASNDCIWDLNLNFFAPSIRKHMYALEYTTGYAMLNHQFVLGRFCIFTVPSRNKNPPRADLFAPSLLYACMAMLIFTASHIISKIGP